MVKLKINPNNNIECIGIKKLRTKTIVWLIDVIQEHFYRDSVILQIREIIKMEQKKYSNETMVLYKWENDKFQSCSRVTQRVKYLS